MTVSVIIPSLNSPIIDQVVACVQEQTHPPQEILVVGRDDDQRLDGYTGVRFVDTTVAVSPAVARNRGAALAQGAILCFLDADCLAAPDWIARLVERHAEGAQVVGGGVALPRSGYWTLCDNVATFAEFLDCTAAGERGHLPSLNMSIRREVFLAVGGFDERFTRPSGEDTDLSLRLRERGYPLWFNPRARVTHCPSRRTLSHIWQHARVFGAAYARVQAMHEGIIGRSLRVAVCSHAIWLGVLVGPALALLDTALVYGQHPALLRYWYAFLGVVYARLGWYMGLTFRMDRVMREE